MPFASGYLEKQLFIGAPKITESPSSGLQTAVVIPCYNEPDVTKTLTSLLNCWFPKGEFEVYIVINAPQHAPDEHVLQNRKTKVQLENWIKVSSLAKGRYHVLFAENLPHKFAGVGLARKIGMDEAIRRFNLINNPDGIIVSLDADCLCDPNYLVEIENKFKNNLSLNGINIHVEHHTDSNLERQEIVNAVVLYELYLRYYVEALRRIDFPYAFHTIGSGFAVKADAYVKQGGMNRRQGGEDFYFLQKLFALSNFSELNSTTVRPAARISDRVPFGTGPELKKIISKGGVFEVYVPEAFYELQALFSLVDSLYQEKEFQALDKIPSTILSFLSDNHYKDKIREIKKNTRTLAAFRKRFFQWFNAFMIVKFLNYAHEQVYAKKNIMDVLSSFFSETLLEEPETWLKYLREKQKATEYSILQ